MSQVTETGPAGWREEWRNPSALALLLANALPLLGVIVLGWEVFPLMLLFWMENVIIGVLNVFKMILVPMEDGTGPLRKMFIIPFFSVHYGIFTLVHGVFVVGLFGGGLRAGGPAPSLDLFVSALRDNYLAWALLGLLASHGFSFVQNFILRNERRHTTLDALMIGPYGRILVLHVAILGGGFLIALLKSPAWGLLLLIILKTALDLRAHLRERRKMAAPIPVGTPAKI